MDIRAVIGVGIVLEVSVIVDISNCNIVPCPFTTTSYADRGLGVGGVLGEYRVKPVHVRIHEGVPAAVRHRYLLVGKHGIAGGLIGQAHVVGSVDELRHVGKVGKTSFELDFDDRLLGYASPCSDNHDSVGRTHAVNGRSGSVLQYGYGLYFLYGEVRHIPFDTVNQHERLAGVERGNASNPELRVVNAGLTCPLDDHGAGHLAGEGVGEVTLGNLHLGLVDGGNGSDDAHPPLTAHTYNHCLFHFKGILVHVNIESQGFGHLKALGLVPQACELNGDVPVRNFEDVVTVVIGS